LAQPLRAPGDGVLIDVVVDGLRRGLLEQVGRREVREPLCQVDGPVLAREPAHPPDYGLPEAMGATGGGHEGSGDGDRGRLNPSPGPAHIRASSGHRGIVKIRFTTETRRARRTATEKNKTSVGFSVAVLRALRVSVEKFHAHEPE